nr:MAG TPA: hypothetical protein [Caudoviricetes sp.]
MFCLRKHLNGLIRNNKTFCITSFCYVMSCFVLYYTFSVLN